MKIPTVLVKFDFPLIKVEARLFFKNQLPTKKLAHTKYDSDRFFYVLAQVSVLSGEFYVIKIALSYSQLLTQRHLLFETFQ